MKLLKKFETFVLNELPKACSILFSIALTMAALGTAWVATAWVCRLIGGLFK